MPDETLEECALRELHEECNVRGVGIRPTSVIHYGPGDEHATFFVDIEDQESTLGCDPEVPAGQEVLLDLRWMRLSDVPERDRAFLWAAGLLGVGDFSREVERWGNRISYPDEGP